MTASVLRSLKISLHGISSKEVYYIVRSCLSSGLNKIPRESTAVNLSDNAITDGNDVNPEPFEFNDDDELVTKMNKSRLQHQHRNIVHGKPPYEEPVIPYHRTERYHRKMFGRYGMKSGANIGVLWPTKEELKNAINYENISYPDTLQVMTARAKLKIAEALEARKKREEDVSSKMAKLEQWKLEIELRAQKKLKEVQAAKERKERLVEEVRRHFGFKVDARDARFKEMLQLKEKEEGKREKAERKKAKQAKMLAKLVSLPSPSVESK